MIRLDLQRDAVPAGSAIRTRTPSVGNLPVALEHPWRLIAFAWALHGLLGLVIRFVPPAAILHAGVTLAFTAWILLTTRVAVNMAYCVAYIIGCEVLWRMSYSGLPWESVEYALIGLLPFAIIRLRSKRPPLFMLAYGALLIPSTITSVIMFRGFGAWEPVMVNVGVHLILILCVWFFRGAYIQPHQINGVMLAVVTPIVGVLAVSVKYTYRDDIEFSSRSSFAATGGFGPNQVSAVLGLGSLLIAYYLLRSNAGRWRILAGGMAILMLVQSMMTFSRGGFFGAIFALLCAGPYLLRKDRIRKVYFPIFVVIAFLGIFVIFPLLNHYTAGALEERLQDTRSSGRDALAAADIELWRENPWFGVGVGISRYSHFEGVQTHTEYTRLVAEHGLPGLMAIFVLGFACFTQIRRHRDPMDAALVTSLIAWVWFFMLVNATRLAAVGFCIGLAFWRPPIGVTIHGVRRRIAVRRRRVATGPVVT